MNLYPHQTLKEESTIQVPVVPKFLNNNRVQAY